MQLLTSTTSLALAALRGSGSVLSLVSSMISSPILKRIEWIEPVADFLIFRFGGPPRYIEQRGHPRLRLRHAPFHIDQRARDRWVALMEQALEQAAFPPPVTATLRQFFQEVATFLINRPSLPEIS
jgi:hypothetical protein